jgi:hypothetical protein
VGTQRLNTTISVCRGRFHWWFFMNGRSDKNESIAVNQGYHRWAQNFMLKNVKGPDSSGDPDVNRG